MLHNPSDQKLRLLKVSRYLSVKNNTVNYDLHFSFNDFSLLEASVNTQ
jgi:hypothetical protein